jgi:hypothetical protein
MAKDLRLGTHFKIVEVAGLRIKRDFSVAYTSGVEPFGLADEFRRFLFAITGFQRTLIQPLKASISAGLKKRE